MYDFLQTASSGSDQGNNLFNLKGDGNFSGSVFGKGSVVEFTDK